jgi:hypothetical protein
MSEEIFEILKETDPDLQPPADPNPSDPPANPPADPNPSDPPAEPIDVSKLDLNEDQIEQILKQKFGENASVQSFKKKEEPKEPKEPEFDETILISTGIAPEKAQEYKTFKSLSITEQAFQVYAKERQGEDNPLTDEPYTDEELREEFEIDNNLYLDDDDPKKKRRLKEFQALVSHHESNHFKDVVGVIGDSTKQKSSNEANTQFASIYEQTKSKLKQSGITYNFEDDIAGTLKVNIPIDAIEKVSLSHTEVAGDITPETVEKAIVQKFIGENINKIVLEVATSYASQLEAARIARGKGIEHRVSEFQRRTTEIPKEIQEALQQADAKKY